MNTFDLVFEDDSPKTVTKLLATSTRLLGVRIVLGRPLPGADLDALTRDLEVCLVGG